jgi:UDP-glucose 4-epimerase
MNIIVTGASGFIGTHLFEKARETYGFNVKAFSSHHINSSHIVCPDEPGFGPSPADLFHVKRAEILIHAGAFTPKSSAQINQISGCNSNINFTKKLLDLPWQNLKKIIFLSTLDVYDNAEGPINEKSSTVASSLYGLSKLYCEQMVNIHAKENGVITQLLRIGHVYGPGEEKYDKVIPKCIKRIVDNKDIELWGDGRELRSFIFIDDVVTAILNAVKLQEQPGVINVVGGNPISTYDLIHRLIKIGDRDIGIIQREFAGTVRNYVFDTAKLKHYLLPEETSLMVGLLKEFRHIEGLRINRH